MNDRRRMGHIVVTADALLAFLVDRHNLPADTRFAGAQYDYGRQTFTVTVECSERSGVPLTPAGAEIPILHTAYTHDDLVQHYMLSDHECEKIAEAGPFENGRNLWVGRLAEKIAGYPSETHCIHITTPKKSVVFGVNAADASILGVVAQIIHGQPINHRWLDIMVKRYCNFECNGEAGGE